MHAEALLKEDAAVFRNRRRVSKQVLEHGRAGPGRMHALRDLRELEGSPSRITLRAAVPIASASASETWPASSITR